MHPLLQQTAHRPIALPDSAWVMRQIWHDLLFMHWVVPPERILRSVPPGLDLDLYDGQAYIAVAPFWMSGIRSRFLTPLPRLNRFPELNVRTYVRYKDVPGVYFFSLDAGNRTAVWAARTAYSLPYYYAEMSVKSLGENYEYRSRRLQDPLPAEFRGRYRPISLPRRRDPESLEYFLTERYCLYTLRDREICRAHIHHLPWPLQDAEAEIELNTMTQASGIDLTGGRPLLHFARELEVLVWWPERA